MNSGFGKLVILVVVIIGFITYVGRNFLPQSESLPPEEIKVTKDMSVEDWISIGETILFSKGQCMVCHPYETEQGMRAPAINTIGADLTKRAADENLGMSGEEFIIQSLIAPKAYKAEGYAPIMPPSQKLLNNGELLALTAYLQSKGAEITVNWDRTMPFIEKYAGAEPAPKEDVKLTATSPEELIALGKTLFDDKGGCIECHTDPKDPDMEFPSLPELYASVEKNAKENSMDSISFLFQSMVNPEAYVAEGQDAIMAAAQDELSPDEIIAVAAYIQSRAGAVTISIENSKTILEKELATAGGL
ncbi:cytochrome c [bacterium]|nr:cytochrome c [bacterium]